MSNKANNNITAQNSESSDGTWNLAATPISTIHENNGIIAMNAAILHQLYYSNNDTYRDIAWGATLRAASRRGAMVDDAFLLRK